MEQAGTSPAQILRQARDLISDPERWTQGRLSDTLKDGYDQTTLRAGSKWCASGAIGYFAAGIAQWEEVAYKYFRPATSGGAVATFNDSHTHAEVLAAFDRAIELAEAE